MVIAFSRSAADLVDQPNPAAAEPGSRTRSCLGVETVGWQVWARWAVAATGDLVYARSLLHALSHLKGETWCARRSQAPAAESWKQISGSSPCRSVIDLVSAGLCGWLHGYVARRPEQAARR